VNETFTVPNDKVGLVIGKGGETIKMIQKECNVKLTINSMPDEKGERPITINGTHI
jgi:polyribonucleotide nucleotidyltransferase